MPTTAYYPLQDTLYRTTALTDDTGAIVEVYDYDAYGNTLIFTAAGTGGNWWADDATQSAIPTLNKLFCGYHYDPETAIYFVNARYYDQILGRFISRDPILSIDQNFYIMIRPTIQTDPFGKTPWHLIGVGLLVIGIYVLSKVFSKAVKDLRKKAMEGSRTEELPDEIQSWPSEIDESTDKALDRLGGQSIPTIPGDKTFDRFNEGLHHKSQGDLMREERERKKQLDKERAEKGFHSSNNSGNKNINRSCLEYRVTVTGPLTYDIDILDLTERSCIRHSLWWWNKEKYYIPNGATKIPHFQSYAWENCKST